MSCVVGAGCGGGGSSATTAPLLVRDGTTRIGVVDTGFVVSHPEYAEFVENYQVFSGGTAVATDTTSIQDTEDPHGTYVVQTIAGNTTGFVDAAGDASLLLAKVKPVNISKPPDQPDYVLETRDILAGTRWAIDQGARAMNYSLGPMYLLDSNLRKAYEYAVSKDVAMVIAAGNESLSLTQDALSAGAGASLFGTEALRKHTLVVGAVQTGSEGLELAPYSNYAGSDAIIQGRFLVAEAPVLVFSRFPAGGAYTALLAYGTSFTAPQVTAALASLLVRWPHLSATSSTQILLDTADQSFSKLYAQNNCGEAGVGTGVGNCGLFYFGQGLLNIDAAVAPAGSTYFATGATVDGSQASVSSTSLTLAPAFGDAAAGLRLNAALFDSYGRDYMFNLASFMQASQVASVGRDAWSVLGARQEVHEHEAGRVRLAFAADGRLLGSSGQFAWGGRHALHWQRSAGRHHDEAAGAYPWLSLVGQGALSRYDWIDEVGVSRALTGGAQLYAGWSHARLEPGAEGSRSLRGASADKQQLRLSWGSPNQTQWAAGWTLTQERETALGGLGAGALGTDGSAGQAAFVQVQRAWDSGWALFGQGEWERLNVQGSGLLKTMSDVATSRWAAGVTHRHAHQRWGLALSQPLRVESAVAHFDVPIGRTLGGDVRRETRAYQLAPSGRQFNVELAVERPWSPAALKESKGQLGLHLIHTHDAGHVSGQKDWAVLGSYRLRW